MYLESSDYLETDKAEEQRMEESWESIQQRFGQEPDINELAYDYKREVLPDRVIHRGYIKESDVTSATEVGMICVGGYKHNGCEVDYFDSDGRFSVCAYT